MKRLKLINSSVRALVDDEDYDRVKKYVWKLEQRKNGQRYVRATVGGKTERLHRLVLKLHHGHRGRRAKRVDHRDRNGVNNQKLNLRFATQSQNKANSFKRKKTSHSRYKGVWKQNGKWRARIGTKGKYYSLGFYRREDQAAAAYDGAARVLFGKFACLNLPS